MTIYKQSGLRGWPRWGLSSSRCKETRVKYRRLVIFHICAHRLYYDTLVYLTQAGQKQEEERKQQEDMKNSILSQVLNQAARARRKQTLTPILRHIVTWDIPVSSEHNKDRQAREGSHGGELARQHGQTWPGRWPTRWGRAQGSPRTSQPADKAGNNGQVRPKARRSRWRRRLNIANHQVYIKKKHQGMRRAYLLFNKFSNHLLSCFGQVLTCQLVATWSVNIYIRTHLTGYTIQRKLAFQTQTQRMVSQKKKKDVGIKI